MALRQARVAERLQELRQTNSLTQEQAAARVGVTLRQWQRWESGDSMPYPRNLDGIASKFGLSVAEFFDEEPAPHVNQLDRIEMMLADLQQRLAVVEAAVGVTDEDPADAIERELAEAVAQAPQHSEDTARTSRAKRRAG